MAAKLPWDECRRELRQPLAGLNCWAASNLVLHLGGLARWCLRPEVLELAATDDSIPLQQREHWRQRPRLPATHGSCWVIFAADPELGLMRPAFVMPLQWVQGQSHSPHLSSSLLSLASRVVSSLGESPDPSTNDWGLQLGPEICDTDLSDLPLECDSGWASLAAGLRVAVDHGRPDPQVWASGSWDAGSGIRRVDHLDEKLALASEFGVREFFVPSDQDGKAKQLAPGLEIGPLRMAERDPRRAIADLTLRLETPPPPPAGPDDATGFDCCVGYYLKLPRGDARATQYYSSHLLPTISHRFRQQLVTAYPHWKPTHLVTIVSASPELVPLVACSLRVAHCLLLYTTDNDPRRDQGSAMRPARQLLEENGIVCVEGAFEDALSLTMQIPAAIRRFTADAPPESTVLDITPGNKWMTWVADHAMAEGSWRLYLRNDTLSVADRRPRPGSEQPVCWQVGSPFADLLRTNENSVMEQSRRS